MAKGFQIEYFSMSTFHIKFLKFLSNHVFLMRLLLFFIIFLCLYGTIDQMRQSDRDARLKTVFSSINAEEKNQNLYGYYQSFFACSSRKCGRDKRNLEKTESSVHEKRIIQSISTVSKVGVKPKRFVCKIGYKYQLKQDVTCSQLVIRFYNGKAALYRKYNPTYPPCMRKVLRGVYICIP